MTNLQVKIPKVKIPKAKMPKAKMMMMKTRKLQAATKVKSLMATVKMTIVRTKWP